MLRSAYTVFLICLTFLLPYAGYAQTKTDTVRIIDDLLEVGQNDEPRGTLLVTQVGKEIYRNAIGNSNLEVEIKNLR